MIMVGLSNKLFLLAVLVGVLAFATGTQAYSQQGICSANGISTGSDCVFRNSPETILPDGSYSYSCNAGTANGRLVSKYQNGCIGTTYYDFSGSSANIQIKNRILTVGDYCVAAPTYNSVQCGYTDYSDSTPSDGGYYDAGDTYNDYSTENNYYDYPDGSDYSSYGGYCGNGYCEYGENAWNCARDCYNPFGSHYYSSCTLNSFPRSVYAGQWSDIVVTYTDLFYSPYTIPVSCGNGYVAYAYGSYGTTGTSFARCYYPNAGLYYQTAYAGGIGCSASFVQVYPQSTTLPPSNGNDGNDGNGDNGNGVSQAQCSVISNPAELTQSGVSTIRVYYSGLNNAPVGASVACGDEPATVKEASCSNGVCTTQCAYTPSRLPYYADVDVLLKVSSTDSLRCTPAFVAIKASTPSGDGNGNDNGSGNNNNGNSNAPAPVSNPSCAILANPNSLQDNGTSKITVLYQDFGNQSVQTAKVFCGNQAGEEPNAACPGGENGMCNSVDCVYTAPSAYPRTFNVRAAIGSEVCSSTTVTLYGNNPTPQPPTPEQFGGMVVTVSDSSSSAPIANAFVIVFKSGAAVDTGFTDSNGVVSFTDLKVGGYSLSVSKTGYSTASSTAAVAADENSGVSISLSNVFASQSCGVSLVSSIVKPDQMTGVRINYDGFSSAPSAVVSCDSNDVPASCSNPVNGKGSCTAQCSFGTENSYPQTKQVSGFLNSNVVCSSAFATLNAPAPTQATLLTRVSECGSGKALQSASVLVDGTTQLYSDSDGVASLSVDPNSVYTIEVSKNGFVSAQFTAQVLGAGTGVSKSVCLNAIPQNAVQDNCDFNSVLIKSPVCPYSVTPQPYQVKISSKNSTDNITVSILYSTNALTGASSVVLLPLQQTIVDFNSTLSDVVGAKNAIVSFASQSCTRNIALQACSSGGLTLEIPENSKTAIAGQDACFDVLLRNRGLASGKVVMTSTSSDSSVTGTFSEKEFTISSQETKQLEYCVKAQGSGQKSFVLNAVSAMGDATASAVLTIPSSASISTNAGSCISLDADSTVQNVNVVLTNNALDGDYVAELIGFDDPNEDGLQAQIVQDKIYDFEKGTLRTLVLRLNPFNSQAGEHRFDLLLKKDGVVAMQQNICFDIDENRNQAVALNPLSLTIQVGKAASSFLTVENTGNMKVTYFVSTAEDLPVQIYPDTFSLAPGEKEEVEIQLTTLQSTRLGSYSIPVRVVSKASEDETYSVTVYCGNGLSKTVACEGGANSCSVSCDYQSNGLYTVTSSIGGETCASTQVRVVENYTDSCYLSFNPQVIKQDNYAVLTVNYRDLSAGEQGNFTLNCGNGQTAVVQNCVGNTGACSAQCYYPDEGSFVASAQSANYSCSTAQIAVVDDGSICRLSAQTNVQRNTANTITMTYDVSELPSERALLLDSVKMLVNVVAGAQSFEPEESRNIIVTAPSSLDLLPGSTALLPITVKNNDRFELNTVIVYLTNLPAGVSVTQPPAFSLEPGASATRNIVLTASQEAPIALSTARIKVESGVFVAPDKSVAINVRTSTGKELLVSEGEPSFSFSSKENLTEITVSIPVTNNENTASVITASADLPPGWRFGFAAVSLQPGQTSLLEFKLVSEQYDDKEFDAVIRLQNTENKVKTIPLAIPSKSSASGLSGLFTASSTTGIIVLLLIIGIVLAGYFFYNSRETQKKLTEDIEKD